MVILDPAPRFESLVHCSKSGDSWSAERMECFNTLMINVFQDRRDNGMLFEEMFLEEKGKYAKVKTREQNNN